jgi:hypothetical protein
MASPSPTSIDLQSIKLGDTIGALQIGSVVGVYLFGVVSLQTWNYFRTYRDDVWLNKVLVGLIWILELGHTIGINFEVYRATIIRYGKPWLLKQFPGIGVAVMFSGAITTIVQAFFSKRLAKLLPRPYSHIGWICIALSVARFAASLYLSVEGINTPDIALFSEHLKWLITVIFVVSAAVDIVIAISMLWYIGTQKKKQAKRISKLLDRIVTYTIRSGLLTSIAAISLILSFLLMPHNFVWLAVYTFVAKLYSNSFLSALNARQELRRDMASSVSVSAPPDFSGGTRVPMQNFTQLSTQSRPAVVITMETTKETLRDMDSPEDTKEHLESYNGYVGYAV